MPGKSGPRCQKPVPAAVANQPASPSRADPVVVVGALLTLLNLGSFNAAFGIGSAGFSDGMVCALG